MSEGSYKEDISEEYEEYEVSDEEEEEFYEEPIDDEELDMQHALAMSFLSTPNDNENDTVVEESGNGDEHLSREKTIFLANPQP